MNRFVMLINFLLITSFIEIGAKPTLKDMKEVQNLSKRFCKQMSDCIKKETSKIPEEQRKMMESMYLTTAACEQMHSQTPLVTGYDSDENKITKAEIEALKKCLEDRIKMSCEKIMQGETPKSCERLEED